MVSLVKGYTGRGIMLFLDFARKDDPGVVRTVHDRQPAPGELDMTPERVVEVQK